MTEKHAIPMPKIPENNQKKAIIFWHSQPVKPGKTIMLSGDFPKNPVIETAPIPDSSISKGKVVSGFEKLVWTKCEIQSSSETTIQADLPESYSYGVYACRVKTSKSCSDITLLNKPDIWWWQGSEGNVLTPGAWIRLFGRALSLDKEPQLLIKTNKKRKFVITASSFSEYDAKFALPEDLPEGELEVFFSNGFGGKNALVEIKEVRVVSKRKTLDLFLNIQDFGAVPDFDQDCTMAFVHALEYAGSNGGGTIFFPRGRYRMDGNWGHLARWDVPSPIQIPENVEVKGESMEEVSLYWPERETPLPTLIEASNNVKISELTVYTQGFHKGVIAGASNFEMTRVRVRANCFYRQNTNEPKWTPESPMDCWKTRGTIDLKGNNFKVTDCDIYSSGVAFQTFGCDYGIIANNRICFGTNYFYSRGSEKIIFENNDCYGISLVANGGCLTINKRRRCGQHFWAGNHIRFLFGGDREGLTLDDHGTAYFGKILAADKTEITLAKEATWNNNSKDNIISWHNTFLYIISGKGVGQYREITGCEGQKITLKSEFKVQPDQNSLLSIGVFNGHNIIYNNSMEDTGCTTQLYPPCIECVVAKNKSFRAGNLNVGSNLTGHMPWTDIRVEPSWYNQFYDNSVEEGNSWAGGECIPKDSPGTAVINGKLGGSSRLNIYGSNTEGNYPTTRWTVVRRHKAKNNSSIRIAGAVSDILLEDCEIRKNQEGIRVETMKDSDICTIDAKINNQCSPQNIVTRNITFEEIVKKHVGKVGC